MNDSVTFVITQQVLDNQKWVEKQFPTKVRYNMLIITADNILSPDVLQEVSVQEEKGEGYGAVYDGHHADQPLKLEL